MLMRTRRRMVLPPNKRKNQRLHALVTAYARQKDAYLVELAKAKNWVLWRLHSADKRAFARRFSVHQLPVHIEDQCIFDACNTMIRWVESVKVLDQWKAQIFRHLPRDEDAAQRHVYFRLIQHDDQIADVLMGHHYDPWLFHLLSHSLRHAPRVKNQRSVVLDSSNYRVGVWKGRQFLSVSTLQKGHRIMLHLQGDVPVQGTLRLVWDDDHWEVHTTQSVKVCRKPFRIKALALDAGITEVFTDQQGQRYGTEYGRIVERVEERLVDTGKKRNQIRQAALHKKLPNESDAQRHQAKIKKHNLGQKKQKRRQKQARAAMATTINCSVNAVLVQDPEQTIVEDLNQMRGKAKGKKMSRQVSLWTRSILQERLDFKTQVRGSHLQAVASAYTSQECSQCGYTAKDNRHGDHFRCLWCGTVDTADGNAAKVILKRSTDPEITWWMKKETIKKILDQRHARITGETLAPVVKAASLVEEAAHR